MHWGDGNSTHVLGDGVKTHTYDDGPATEPITVDLVDEDGTFLDQATRTRCRWTTSRRLSARRRTRPRTRAPSDPVRPRRIHRSRHGQPVAVTVDCGDSSSNSVFTELAPGAIADTAPHLRRRRHVHGDRHGRGGERHGAGQRQCDLPGRRRERPALRDASGRSGLERGRPGVVLSVLHGSRRRRPVGGHGRLGDGTADTVFSEGTAGPIAPKSHTYADNGVFTVTVTVDEDGGAGAAGLGDVPGHGRERRPGRHSSGEPDRERGDLEPVRPRQLHRSGRGQSLARDGRLG